MLQIVRWAIIIYVALAAYVHFQTVDVRTCPIVVSAAIVAVLTIAIGLLSKRLGKLENPIILAIVDIGLVSVIVLFSDGIQSPFYPLFYVALIEAAAVSGTRGAIAGATVITTLSFVAEVVDVRQTWTEPRILADLARTVPYLFIIALITGALRDRIRRLATAAAILHARQENIESELAVARTVQQAQLPSHVPELKGATVAKIYEPAREVGGDLYDFYPIGEHSLGITVADVAGKGVPAALLVASAKYAVRQYASEDRSAMMRQINQHILEESSEDTFVALLHGSLDTSRGEFRYVNAGQMPPIVVRACTGKAEVIEGYDLPAGVSASATYTERTIQLGPGDLLVLYTDGLTDALGLGGDGLESLRELLDRVDSTDLLSWCKAMSAAIKSPLRSDDITLVAVKLDH